MYTQLDERISEGVAIGNFTPHGLVKESTKFIASNEEGRQQYFRFRVSAVPGATCAYSIDQVSVLAN